MSFSEINITEEECKKFLIDLRWGGTPTCPKCGDKKPYFMHSRGHYRCSERICKKEFSITSGTVFNSINLSLALWFYVAYLLKNDEKLTSIKLSEIIGTQQTTAWKMMNKIKMAIKYEEDNRKIIEDISLFISSKL